MTVTGFLILVAIVLLLIWIYWELGGLPGRTAKKRNHPQADAINVLGWIGLLLGGIPWLVALVWAYTRPPLFMTAGSGSQNDQLITEERSNAPDDSD